MSLGGLYNPPKTPTLKHYLLYWPIDELQYATQLRDKPRVWLEIALIALVVLRWYVDFALI